MITLTSNGAMPIVKAQDMKVERQFAEIESTPSRPLQPFTLGATDSLSIGISRIFGIVTIRQREDSKLDVWCASLRIRTTSLLP